MGITERKFYKFGFDGELREISQLECDWLDGFTILHLAPLFLTFQVRHNDA